MTFSFGLVAALSLCANNHGLTHTPSEIRPLPFPNMLCPNTDLKLTRNNLQR